MLHSSPVDPFFPWLVSTEGKLGRDDGMELLLLLLLPIVAGRNTAASLAAVELEASPSTVISVYTSTPSACELKVSSSDGKYTLLE